MDNIHRTHYADQLVENIIGHTVTVAGWVEDIRDIGKLAFITIRDVTGSAQAVATAENLEIAKETPRQSSVIINGKVQKSKARDNPVEIKVDKLILISRAVHPLPIDPTGRVESSLDKRLDSRALDLRNPRTAALFLIRSSALESIRMTLHDQDFIEVNTPKIIGSASEGGANLFAFDYFKKKAYLAQSPQLYKEQLVMGLDRVFEIAPYFRAENSHTVRHLSEFTSVDAEAAFIDYNDAMDIVEKVIKNVSESLSINYQNKLESMNIKVPKIPNGIERIPYSQCLNELESYGEKIEFGDDLSDASLRRLGEKHKGFYFITDWPLKLKPFYIHEKEDRPELSESFDLQFGYLELVSGGRRQHDPSKIHGRLKEQGLNPGNFEEHLQVFNWGMPPHSGWGLGLDRLIMVLTSIDNVRESVLYPRDTERLTP